MRHCIFPCIEYRDLIARVLVVRILTVNRFKEVVMDACLYQCLHYNSFYEHVDMHEYGAALRKPTIFTAVTECVISHRADSMYLAMVMCQPLHCNFMGQSCRVSS